jgi:hypothetical protein
MIAPARDNPAMLYQITCTCGHAFQRSDEQLKGPVACPACARPLSVVIQAPASATPASEHAEPTKRCPFCGEVILAIARKCKHCGEFLDRTAVPAAGGASAPGAPAAASHAPAAPAAEEPVFALTTSQWDNVWRFLIILTAFLLISVGSFYIVRDVAPVIILASMAMGGLAAWAFYLRTRSIRVIIRPMRIEIETGILSRHVDTLELFRVKDTALKQNVAERILGIGTISLMTDDASAPELVLNQIPRAREVLKYLQTQIPIAARQRGAVYMGN